MSGLSKEVIHTYYQLEHEFLTEHILPQVHAEVGESAFEADRLRELQHPKYFDRIGYKAAFKSTIFDVAESGIQDPFVSSIKSILASENWYDTVLYSIFLDKGTDLSVNEFVKSFEDSMEFVTYMVKPEIDTYRLIKNINRFAPGLFEEVDLEFQENYKNNFQKQIMKSAVNLYF